MNGGGVELEPTRETPPNPGTQGTALYVSYARPHQKYTQWEEELLDVSRIHEAYERATSRVVQPVLEEREAEKTRKFNSTHARKD